MKLKGVHHVSLTIDDIEEARRFYVDVLGLQELSRPGFDFPGVWLRSESQEIHLMAYDDHEAPRRQHFAFRVDDLDGTIEELQGKGVKVSDPNTLPTGRQAFFRDPSGNLIEINQPGT